MLAQIECGKPIINVCFVCVPSHVRLFKVHSVVCEANNSACQLSLHIQEKWAQQKLTSSNIHFWFVTFYPRLGLCPITSCTLFQCLNLSEKNSEKEKLSGRALQAENTLDLL